MSTPQQRVIMPPTAPIERQRAIQDEWAVRYGVLMGGTAIADCWGVGEFWKGHNQIYRRCLTGFTHQQVRVRNEAEDSAALDEPGGSLLGDPLREHRRLMDKSPSVCMKEMQMHLGNRCANLGLLLVVPAKKAMDPLNPVLPAEVAARPLVEVIEYLETPVTLPSQREALRQELLEGAIINRNYMQIYTDATVEEIGEYATKKTGKFKVDSVDREYFWELKRTLPENVRKETMTELGKEIAVAVAGKGNDSEVAAEMRRANELKAEELELRRRELELKEASFAGASNKGRKSD